MAKAVESPSKQAVPVDGWQRFIQIALPCLKFSPQVALCDDVKKLERDLRVLESAAKTGTVTPECKKLAKQYFYYAEWLLGKTKLDPAKNSIEYFFKHHNATPSDNIKAIGPAGEGCKTRIARLIEKDTLKVKSILDGTTFIAELDFRPGSAILENLDKLDKLVLMSSKPKLYRLKPALREKVRENLERIDFRIGPWIKTDSQYYISHWNVLSHCLTEEELEKILALAE